jgi:hypothetical protein
VVVCGGAGVTLARLSEWSAATAAATAAATS